MMQSAKTIIFSFIITLLILLFIKQKIVFQFTDSMPKGIYFFSKGQDIHHGQIVVFKMPEGVLEMVRERSWSANNSTLMKQVYGMPGDTVLIKDLMVFINNEYLGRIKLRDRQGLPLPIYQRDGTYVLRQNEYFVASNYIPNSFDSRYFGPINHGQIIGTAKPFFIYKEKQYE